MTAGDERLARRASGPEDQSSYPKLPHPRRRVPLLGDVLTYDTNASYQSCMDYAAKLGPIFEFKVFGARVVTVVGVEFATDLSDESRFCKHIGRDVEALRIIGGDGLATAYNDEPNWRKARTLLMPAFGQPAMRRYHPTMLDVAAELTASWDGRAGNGETVDVSADTTRVTFETIGRCAAAYSFGCFKTTTTHPFIEHMVSALRGVDRVGMLRDAYLPQFLANRAERKFRLDAAFLHGVVDEIIATRRNEGPGQYDDLLEIMLAPGPDGRPALDDANIRYQLITFLVAGHETTSGALSFALYFLSRHPEVFARARAEVDEAWGEQQRPEFEQVGKLRYVRRVLDETLRLQPPLPGYYRAAREDTMLAGVYPMRKGDWALVLVGGLHRDPRWGDDPDAFDPDRFAPELVRARPANLYKPFGTGERSCIGRQFTLHEAVLVLGTLIRRYDLIADPDYELQIQERMTMMPRDFQLGLRIRRPWQ